MGGGLEEPAQRAAHYFVTDATEPWAWGARGHSTDRVSPAFPAACRVSIVRSRPGEFSRLRQAGAPLPAPSRRHDFIDFLSYQVPAAGNV